LSTVSYAREIADKELVQLQLKLASS
jgi:hypothetical protein